MVALAGPRVAAIAGTAAAAELVTLVVVAAVLAAAAVAETGRDGPARRGVDMPLLSAGVALGLAVQPSALPRPEGWSPEWSVAPRRNHARTAPKLLGSPVFGRTMRWLPVGLTNRRLRRPGLRPLASLLPATTARPSPGASPHVWRSCHGMAGGCAAVAGCLFVLPSKTRYD